MGPQLLKILEPQQNKTDRGNLFPIYRYSKNMHLYIYACTYTFAKYNFFNWLYYYIFHRTFSFLIAPFISLQSTTVLDFPSLSPAVILEFYVALINYWTKYLMETNYTKETSEDFRILNLFRYNFKIFI